MDFRGSGNRVSRDDLSPFGSDGTSVCGHEHGTIQPGKSQATARPELYVSRFPLRASMARSSAA